MQEGRKVICREVEGWGWGEVDVSVSEKEREGAKGRAGEAGVRKDSGTWGLARSSSIFFYGGRFHPPGDRGG